MSPQPFGRLPDGTSVEKYTLRNATGASADIITLGGTITALRVPDRAGALANVVLGCADFAGYAHNTSFLGVMVGRIGGRLTRGELILPDGKRQLVCNDGPNHLHGGRIGFDKRVWTVRASTAQSLTLFYRSPDGEEGYPGNLDVTVTYTLTDRNELVFATSAVSDRVTPLSMPQHAYFNLAGEGSGDVRDHMVQIFAAQCIPAADARMTLSNRLAPVAGTANDFNSPRRLGDAIPGLFQQHGEHYFIRASAADAPTPVARVTEPRSGRVLTVSTDDCGLQFYTGKAFKESITGPSGRAYGPYAGLCLECQGCPNGSHHPELGDILVRPGAPRRRTTIYAFSTQ